MTGAVHVGAEGGEVGVVVPGHPGSRCAFPAQMRARTAENSNNREEERIFRPGEVGASDGV